ncbi:MAG: serine/threonine protein kinase [Armatimonadetes bacterium]|nr:serine/threonine protein kinase [Armatimonadota bacterium]
MSQVVLNERYVLESELGRGGMGIVYLSRDIQLDRHVAVKVLPPEFTHDLSFLDRFRREVLNTAKLSHPNIAQVFDVGQHEETHYYVMQLVDGSDLHSEILKKCTLSLDETVRIIRQVGLALDCAHAEGVVHRDIKPENVLLDRQGNARVVDFGIAKTMEGTRLTGGMIGTPEYMSPEQARSEDVDGRSDQYSLGVVVYEMLTGTTPFRSATSQPWAIVNMHINAPPPDPRSLRLDLPEHVASAIFRALAKIPAHRFASCSDFAQALENGTCASVSPRNTGVSENVTLVGTAPLPTTAPRSSKRPLVGLLAAALAVMIIGFGLVLGTRSKPIDLDTPPPPSISVVQSAESEPMSSNQETSSEEENSDSNEVSVNTPLPRFDVTGLPGRVYVGQSFEFVVNAVNEGISANSGSITAGFTGSPRIEMSSDSKSPRVWRPGEKIGLFDIVSGAFIKTRIAASEVGAEAYYQNQTWGRGGKRYARFTVIPSQPGRMLITVRCTLTLDSETAHSIGISRFHTYPSIDEADGEDQQGCPARFYTVEVER